MTLSKVIFPLSDIEFSNYSDGVISYFKSMYAAHGFHMYVIRGENRLIGMLPFNSQPNKERMKTRFWA